MNLAEVSDRILSSYVVRRLMLIVPTLFGVLLVNFAIIQAAPGGPVDQAISRLQGMDASATAGIGGGSVSNSINPGQQSSFDASRGIDPELLAELNKQFGFDKPAHERFFTMLGDYLTFDFGESFYQDVPVIDLIIDRLPVSLSLGGATLLIVYLIAVPLGIRKAVHDGSAFDAWTSLVILIAFAIPGFVLAMLLIIVFAGGEFLNWFPLRGLVSDHHAELGFGAQILDRIHHIALPVAA
ncbi:MAG TPA: microcin ABC transporter permease, partial [Gammaproteobacteria bacterium]|nr:microcin ABC transporter permease [Gammaproteobacteria bacterium]